MDTLRKILINFKKKYSSKFSSAILVGSTVYLDKLRSGSDIDLVIVMNNIIEWKNAYYYFCVNKSYHMIKDSIKLFNQGKVKYFCLKFKIDNIDFSVDFILKSTLNEFIDNFEAYLYKKIYKVSPTKQNRYFIFGREKKIIYVKKENILYHSLYMIHSPYGTLYNDYFYSGILLSKFINGYSILWDTINAESKIDTFCKKGIRKIIIHNHKNNMDEVLRNINNYDRLPKKHIEKQIKKYREVFNTMKTEQDITTVAERLGLSKKVIKIYQDVYELFPPDTGRPELRYVRRTWIFPQHLNIMIKEALKMCDKYDGDKEICSLAILIHDVGLVYGRTSASPEGHEDRSINYAKEMLLKHKYDKDIINQVIRCIAVTNSEVIPITINEKIVRTADALSKFNSCHFIAKAAYSKGIDEYLDWMHKKLRISYDKICFDDELKECETAYNYLMSVVNSYMQQKKEFS